MTEEKEFEKMKCQFHPSGFKFGRCTREASHIIRLDGKAFMYYCNECYIHVAHHLNKGFAGYPIHRFNVNSIRIGRENGFEKLY